MRHDSPHLDKAWQVWYLRSGLDKPLSCGGRHCKASHLAILRICKKTFYSQGDVKGNAEALSSVAYQALQCSDKALLSPVKEAVLT